MAVEARSKTKSGDKMDKQFLIQRQSLGALGLFLPFLCLLFGFLDPQASGTWAQSMSMTYWTNARDVFTAVLIMCGAFLITYSGYDWRDKLVNITAGVTAIGVALFPTAPETYLSPATYIGTFSCPANISNILHSVFALIFFACLALNILWLFTKGESGTPKKKLRNIIYKICGWGIVASFIICAPGIYFNWHFMMIWILEAFLLVFFGVAWLVKGRAIKLLND